MPPSRLFGDVPVQNASKFDEMLEKRLEGVRVMDLYFRKWRRPCQRLAKEEECAVSENDFVHQMTTNCGDLDPRWAYGEGECLFVLHEWH